MGPGLWTTQGHYIVLWDVDDGIAYINDPASTDKIRTKNSYKTMASQCKQYFCFNQEPKSIKNDDLYCFEQDLIFYNPINPYFFWSYIS